MQLSKLQNSFLIQIVFNLDILKISWYAIRK